MHSEHHRVRDKYKYIWDRNNPFPNIFKYFLKNKKYGGKKYVQLPLPRDDYLTNVVSEIFY